jgi:two-component system KDP operon response regulator KdpE
MIAPLASTRVLSCTKKTYKFENQRTTSRPEQYNFTLEKILENIADTSSTAQVGLDYDQLERHSEQELALIVDDDDTTVDMLKLILRRAEFNVVGAMGGHEAVEKCAKLTPDVILLDIMMPEMDGWETYSNLRKMTDAPVVVVSAGTTDDWIVKAFDLGMEDYVTKPFSAKEVVARVKAAVKRKAPSKPNRVRVFPEADLTINLDTRQVTLGKEKINLTPLEYGVFSVLVEATPEPVSYETIVEQVWGEDNAKARKRLKWAIHSLRRKLEEDSSRPERIKTHTNYGYQFVT